MSEQQFNQKVAKYFRSKLQEEGFEDIHLEPCIYILRDFTFAKRKDGWQLLAGFQEQDIVFYKDKVARDQFCSKLVKTAGTGLRGDVIIPLVICELKVAPIVTHVMITSEKIASEIKQTFPHCACYFVMDTNKERRLGKETVLRQGKGFDRVFLEWEEEKETIWQDIKRHFEYQKRLGVL